MYQAVRAKVVHVLVVATLVEQATDLMYPCLTGITLHPALLNLIIILLLLQLRLAHISPLRPLKRHLIPLVL